MGAVEVVVLNTLEAKPMILMVNKQIDAYMVFYLKDKGLDDSFIHDLAQEALYPILCHEVDEYTWDSKSIVLTTKADTTEQEEGERMENEA